MIRPAAASSLKSPLKLLKTPAVLFADARQASFMLLVQPRFKAVDRANALFVALLFRKLSQAGQARQAVSVACFFMNEPTRHLCLWIGWITKITGKRRAFSRCHVICGSRSGRTRAGLGGIRLPLLIRFFARAVLRRWLSVAKIGAIASSFLRGTLPFAGSVLALLRSLARRLPFRRLFARCSCLCTGNIRCQ
jgi:hypothetical protein